MYSTQSRCPSRPAPRERSTGTPGNAVVVCRDRWGHDQGGPTPGKPGQAVYCPDTARAKPVHTTIPRDDTDGLAAIRPDRQRPLRTGSRFARVPAGPNGPSQAAAGPRDLEYRKLRDDQRRHLGGPGLLCPIASGHSDQSPWHENPTSRLHGPPGTCQGLWTRRDGSPSNDARWGHVPLPHPHRWSRCG